MTDTLFPLTPECPASVLLSIYNLYPRKCNRKEALKRISEALDRICAGEIDGNPRTQAEAIAYLRLRTEWIRREMFGREEKFIPHATTFYHQQRYLRPALDPKDMPTRLESAVRILARYPKMPDEKIITKDIMAFMQALITIDRALDVLEHKGARQTPDFCEGYLSGRTRTYASCVAQWPAQDLQFVPSPVKWFGEQRYEHPESSWTRKPANGFSQERDQLKRLIQ